MPFKKGKVGRVARALKAREGQVHEDDKRALIFKGPKTSNVITSLLRDINSLKKPASKLFSRKNDIRPFETAASVEFLCDKNLCSLFAYGSHTKKRPHNLIMGRLFDFKLLDMFEFGVENYVPMQNFHTKKRALGSKPLMLFVGEEFEHDATFKMLKNFFLDYFRGFVTERINLVGIDHALVLTIADGKILFRSYSIGFTKSGERVPNVDLELMGPCFDLTLRRSQLAPTDMRKAALRQPRELTPHKVKNISKDSLGSAIGRVHMKRQNFEKLHIRRVKGLKAPKRKTDAPESDAPVLESVPAKRVRKAQPGDE